MKHLLLIRHAKTEAKGYDKDFDRKLIPRGIDDCEVMSKRLKKVDFNSELVKFSSSNRTQQTAKSIAKHMKWAKEKLIAFDNLYLATAKDILNEIEATGNDINNLVVIGHNPGISDLFNEIGDASTDEMPTCAMALFRFDITSWKDIKDVEGHLEWYDWPGKKE